MYIIAGLGNPTREYEKTRHNVGFDTIDVLADKLNTSVDEKKFKGLYGRGIIAGEKVILLKPQTFMNLSGVAVKALLKKLKLSPQELLVVCDDLDLELGRIKIRPHGSSAGQRGLGSIIEQLGAEEFNRLRFGIGRPRNAEDARRYVLSGFLRKEKGVVEEAKENAVACALSWVENGIIMTMDSFNTRSRNE